MAGRMQSRLPAQKASPMIARAKSLFITVFLTTLLCFAPACGGGSSTTPPPPPPPPPSQMEVLYVTSASQVTAFPVNSSTGALGTPASVTGPQTSLGIVVSPNGQFLYVSDTLND